MKKIASFSMDDVDLDTLREMSEDLNIPKSELLSMSLEAFRKYELKHEQKKRITELDKARKKIREAMLYRPSHSLAGDLIISSTSSRKIKGGTK
jgi:hypothetical protein